MGTQHLGDGQHQVGRRRTLGQLALELEANDLGGKHVHGLAAHDGLGLDAADTPAQHAHAVDHGRVRVGADERVGVDPLRPVLRLGQAPPRQILQVHLMHNARRRGHRTEVIQRLLPPLEERVPLVVPLELLLRVDRQRNTRREVVHLHRVIDDQIARDGRVDLLWVAAEILHRVTHGGKVNNTRHAGEVLQHHTPGHERHLDAVDALGVVVGQPRDVIVGDDEPIKVPHHRLKQHPNRERHLLNIPHALRLQRLEVDVAVVVSIDRECVFRVERVACHGVAPCGSGGVLIPQEVWDACVHESNQ